MLPGSNLCMSFYIFPPARNSLLTVVQNLTKSMQREEKTFELLKEETRLSTFKCYVRRPSQRFQKKTNSQHKLVLPGVIQHSKNQ